VFVVVVVVVVVVVGGGGGVGVVAHCALIVTSL